MKKNASDIEAISKRLYELRTFSDYSTGDIAEKLGIDEMKYKEYESGVDEIPINLIYKFASILGTEVSYVLSGALPTDDVATVVYDGKGGGVKRYEGYSFTSLATDFKNKTMNPMLVVIEPTNSPELVKHGGQEFNFVVEGKLRVIVGEKEYYLRKGDSIYFDPSYPHAQLAMDGKSATFLTVINE